MASDLTPVRLRGHLGARFGGGMRRLNVSSPGEAVRLLCATVPGFEDYVRNSKGGFKVVVRDAPITGDQINEPSGRREIRFVPVRAGADSGFKEVLMGAALIGLAFATGGTSLAWTSPYLMGMGVSMALGGISKMLMSAPNASDANSTPNSFLFNNASNTAAQNIPVPVLYGQMTIVPPLINETIDTEAFNSTIFGLTFDGLGNWSGNGDTTPWGASLKCL